MTHSGIDDVKWRVAELLGESFGLYSEDEIAELEAVLRTDDPEELQCIHDKWAQRPPIEQEDPPLPDCLDCRRAIGPKLTSPSCSTRQKCLSSNTVAMASFSP